MVKNATLSLDLDNLWSYLKVYGDPNWKKYPSYFDIFIPRILDFLRKQEIKITFFIVGQDAAITSQQPLLQEITKDGHECGNHSFYHEPWMEHRTEEEIKNELQLAHRIIESVTGYSPKIFRGPGFCLNQKTLKAVKEMNYLCDASLFPSILTPISRLYYLFHTKQLSSEEKEQRRTLFGKFSNAWMPLKPFKYPLENGSLLEIPVTTIPFLRLPIHLSYLIWLSKFSKAGAIQYLKGALCLCKLCGVEPSFLLHPLDFLGGEEVPELSFFPGMNLSKEHKMEIAEKAISLICKKFEPISFSKYAANKA